MASAPVQCTRCGRPRDPRAAGTECRNCWRTTRDRATEKECRGCGQTYPVEHFAWRPDGRGGRKRRSRCRTCEATASREHRAKDPDRHTAAKRRWEQANPAGHERIRLRRAARILGLDPDVVTAHFDAHDGRCDACRRTPAEVGTGHYRRLAIDHSHTTGRFRGLLCTSCNLAAGHAGDDPTRLRALADYLDRAP